MEGNPGLTEFNRRKCPFTCIQMLANKQIWITHLCTQLFAWWDAWPHTWYLGQTQYFHAFGTVLPLVTCFSPSIFMLYLTVVFAKSYQKMFMTVPVTWLFWVSAAAVLLQIWIRREHLSLPHMERPQLSGDISLNLTQSSVFCTVLEVIQWDLLLQVWGLCYQQLLVSHREKACICLQNTV